MTKNSRSRSSSIPSGFTLVELVIVIMLLSVLAVTAYARMSKTDSQARLAALQSFKATITSVATMAKGVCLSEPQCNAYPSAATISGNTIFFSNRYPVGWLPNSDGSGSLHQLIDPVGFRIQANLSDTNHAVYFSETGRDTSHCKLEYDVSVELSITIDSSGC